MAKEKKELAKSYFAKGYVLNNGQQYFQTEVEIGDEMNQVSESDAERLIEQGVLIEMNSDEAREWKKARKAAEAGEEPEEGTMPNVKMTPTGPFVTAPLGTPAPSGSANDASAGRQVTPPTPRSATGSERKG